MKQKLLGYQSLSADIAALLLRLIFGGLFLYFGILKLQMFGQLYNQFADPIGIGERLTLFLVLFAEVICSSLIILGLFTRLAVIPVFILMIVVFFIVHAKDPFLQNLLAFLLLLLCIPVFIVGSGRFSMDRLFFKK
jgi:putative oxidoreductase